jgi:adenylosuccinate synthase
MVKAYIVVDLGFGDSGKGTVTDALVDELDARWVVRFNGGAQAGHNVVLSDGRHHTFSQFGAGTFRPGVRTFLSKFMVVHPGGLLEEARTLRAKGVPDALERLYIDPQARVITPFHQAANRLREVLRGSQRHGSCGLGVGETMHHSLEHPSEAVVAADLNAPGLLRRKLCRIQQRYWEEFSPRRKELSSDSLGNQELAVLESSEAADQFVEQAAAVATRVSDRRPEDGNVIFEGAQGVLLDEWRGFHPYTTWSTCTFDNALELVRDWGGEAVRLGVVRSYATRHGAGPFPTEDRALSLEEPHNCWGPWQEGFRLGWLDLVLLRYAIEACGGLDGLAVTHMERVKPGWKVAEGYRDSGKLALGTFGDLDYQECLTSLLLNSRPDFREVQCAQELLAILGEFAPVVLTSWGPTSEEKRFEGSGLVRPLAAA